jgi:predicted HTH domain antitoxin
MQITVQLPDDLAQRPNPAREALDSLAMEGYRSGAMSHFQAAQLLGMSRIEFDGFLKDRAVVENAYGLEDLMEDRRTLDDLRRRGIIKA